MVLIRVGNSGTNLRSVNNSLFTTLLNVREKNFTVFNPFCVRNFHLAQLISLHNKNEMEYLFTLSVHCRQSVMKPLNRGANAQFNCVL